MAKTFNLNQLDIELKSSDDYAIREISVAVIDENPLNNEIYDFNDDDYKKLVDDIASVGLIQPICVRRNPILSDRYIVISGHRRLKACKQLGYLKVPCIVKRVETDADAIKADIMLLTSNIAVRSRSITERGREASYLKELIRKLKEQGGEEYKGKTDDIVAQLMDVAPSYVRRLVRIDKASDEVKELVDKEALSLKEALALEEMPAQKRKAVIQKLKNAESAEVARGVVRRKAVRIQVMSIFQSRIMIPS